MLQIKNVSKVYRTGSLVQRALNRVSLNLRDNEFVAILGQSGSGKTTLLNIIGGLDCYDKGDLVINGVSTKKYNHRDWDAYRNHTVGFVFQSYNLIPHQSVLANVELALTISGISRRQRTKKAMNALKRVGLADHIHKKPSQLSGGQMQRVAIARALVNDPDILLADEPTGALDSETSIQVMDLLKEVARDRLVVMVTHNPELAEMYATRIVRLRDGEIISDSDPYDPDTEESAPVHKRMGKASMSFLTALMLSFNNLWTKKTRTVLVAFAGSIGIIGIAMILSLSNGVDRYIKDVEEETLQSYPLQITDTSFNLAMYIPDSQDGGDEDEPEETAPDVREWLTVTNMFSRVRSNDLAALREYLESGRSSVYDYVQSIEYDYNLVPQIFALRNGKARQVNPDRSFAALGFTAADTMNGLLSSFSSTDSFHAMPARSELYTTQYDVKAGRWPERYSECVLVLSAHGRVADLTLYTMGMKDPDELEQMVKAFADGETARVEGEEGSYDYDDFLGIEFRLVNAADYYTYDPEYGVWTDRSGDDRYIRELAEKAERLTIVGVVQPKEDSSSPVLTMGICYPASLIGHIIDSAAARPIVSDQLKAPKVNVFTGLPFGEEPERTEMDFNSLFSVDEESLSKAFQFDPENSGFDPADLDLSGMDLSDMDLSAAIDPGDYQVTMPSLSSADIAELLGSVKINFSMETMEALFRSLVEAYLDSAAEDPSTDYKKLPESMREYMNTQEAREILLRDIREIWAENSGGLITTEQLFAVVQEVMAGYPAYAAERAAQEPEDPDAPAEGFDYLEDYLQTPEVQAILLARTEELQQQAASIPVTEEQLERIITDLLSGYEVYAEENSLPEPSKLEDSFREFMATEQARRIIADGVSRVLDTSALEAKATQMFSRYSAAMAGQISGMMTKLVSSLTDAVSSAIRRNLGSLMESLSQNLMDAFSIDTEQFAKAFTMNMDPQELRDLMTSLMSREDSSYEGNLKKLGYADRLRPSAITIYPTDFNGKQEVKLILDGYNAMQTSRGAEDKVIVYTDVVDTLMSSVTGIVNAISYVLIAFVAISLVVSSVMIGVITYISVLERKKEIGILRAIGASKRNIAQVFNAETFIIGALAGVFGIAITLLLLIPANSIIHNLTGQTGINASLPPGAAVLLILLSIVLTLIGGIIPSMKAAGSDPVAALRSE